MLKHFSLHQPDTLAEAISLRQAHGEGATFYAGGTELLLTMKLGLAHWAHLVDVKRIPELKGIALEDSALVIGAAETHHVIERDPRVQSGWPALARLEGGVGNIRVRAAGTLAGNLAFAEPHADPPALLVALGASVVLAGRGGQRVVLVEDFLVGPYETSIGQDELVLAVRVPRPASGAFVGYTNFRVLERPSAAVAVVAEIVEGRFNSAPTIVLGALEGRPRRLETSQFAGARVADVLRQVGALAQASVKPVDDLAGSAGYKAHLASVLVRRLLATAA